MDEDSDGQVEVQETKEVTNIIKENKVNFLYNLFFLKVYERRTTVQE
jgi:hypothetical protein